jgi:hypothetical protein
VTNLRLISASIPLTINRKGMPRPISRKWSSLSNSRSRIHLTHSVTQEDPLHPKASDFRFENDADDAGLFIRGQLASYAAAHAGCQFRVHIFCVLVCGVYPRFIRCAIVTRRFNYIKDPHFLANFFWRYDHLDRRRQVTTLPSLPLPPLSAGSYTNGTPRRDLH